MKVNVLAYVEDGKLTIGLRSNVPHTECGLYDGEHYFNYYTVEEEVKEIMTMEVIPSTKGWEIYVEGDLYDEIETTNTYGSAFTISV